MSTLRAQLEAAEAVAERLRRQIAAADCREAGCKMEHSGGMKLLISFDVGVKRGVSVGYVVGDDSMHYIPIGDEMYDRLRSHEEIERLLREAGVSVTLVEHAAAGEPLTAAELVASIPVKDDLVDVPVRAPHDYLQHDPTKRVGKRRRGGRFGAGGKPTKHCFIGRKP